MGDESKSDKQETESDEWVDETNGESEISAIGVSSRECGGTSVTVVLRQGVPNAQGADVLMFVLKSVDQKYQLELSLYQAKNWKSKRYSSAMEKAACSLGIDAQNNDKTKKLANESVECEFSITTRAIVFAYPYNKRALTDMNAFRGLYDNEKPELWSKEMLEPTISALAVATDNDEAEQYPSDEDLDSNFQ